MKSKWMSALAIAAAFAMVTVPSAVLPNTAQAQITQEGAGEWDSFGVKKRFIYTYYTGVQAFTSGGGNLMVKLHNNYTGGTINIRLLDAYGNVVRSTQALYTWDSVTYSNLSSGTYMLEMKTTGAEGEAVWEVLD